MKHRISLVLGAGLVALVLWFVGWRDRITDARGREYVGRIVERTPTTLVIRTKQGRRAVPLEGATVREGLGSVVRRLRQRPGVLLGGLGLHLLGLLFTFVRWGGLLRGAGLATPPGPLLRVSWVGHFCGQVLPGGVATGDVMKALYLSRAHPGRGARGAVTVFVDRMTGLLVLGFLATLAVLAVPNLGPLRAIVLGVFGAGVAGTAVLFSGRVRRFLRLHSILRRLPFRRVLRECQAAIDLYGDRPLALVRAGGVALAGHLVLLAAFAFYARAIGDWLPLVAVGAAIPVAQVLSAIPGLPGGWGVGDAAFLALLVPAGVPPAQAVGVSVLYRLGQTILSLPGAMFLAPGRSSVRA